MKHPERGVSLSAKEAHHETDTAHQGRSQARVSRLARCRPAHDRRIRRRSPGPDPHLSRQAQARVRRHGRAQSRRRTADLLGSMWLARRGSLIGLLLWPGTLFYVLYAFYLIGVPFNALFLLYVALVTVSTYTMIGLLASIDGEVVRQRLSAVMPRRTVGGALVGLAILYFALETLLIVATLASRALLDPKWLWLGSFDQGKEAFGRFLVVSAHS